LLPNTHLEQEMDVLYLQHWEEIILVSESSQPTPLTIWIKDQSLLQL